MTCEHWIEVKNKRDEEVGYCKFCGRIVDCIACRDDCECAEAWEINKALEDSERIR